MDVLNILFGSEARVRIMRLFLFNPEVVFDFVMVCEKSKVDVKTVKKEFSVLEKAELIKGKDFSKIIQKNVRGKINDVKVKTHGYFLNQNFPYLLSLRQLLISTKTFEGVEIVKRLSRVGKLKLVLVSGVFTHDKDSRVDMLVVGNNLNKTTLSKVVKTIEAELGKELVYAFFETQDFEYRTRMYDKLIRDIMDYPHQILLNKISNELIN
ncbi:MAG: hypothetical protein PHN69_00105 [Candidatus Pacebacteria bacterium]|nr:hypothetical protein [Candidatus Paceibacterota bacterium]